MKTQYFLKFDNFDWKIHENDKWLTKKKTKTKTVRLLVILCLYSGMIAAHSILKYDFCIFFSVCFRRILLNLHTQFFEGPFCGTCSNDTSTVPLQTIGNKTQRSSDEWLEYGENESIPWSHTRAAECYHPTFQAWDRKERSILQQLWTET